MLIIDGIAGASGRELPLEQNSSGSFETRMHVLVERDAPEAARLVAVDRRVARAARRRPGAGPGVEAAVEEVDLGLAGDAPSLLPSCAPRSSRAAARSARRRRPRR